eukprot:58503-Chlamydomonas_euryale.AAC.2
MAAASDQGRRCLWPASSLVNPHNCTVHAAHAMRQKPSLDAAMIAWQQSHCTVCKRQPHRPLPCHELEIHMRRFDTYQVTRQIPIHRLSASGVRHEFGLAIKYILNRCGKAVP